MMEQGCIFFFDVLVLNDKRGTLPPNVRQIFEYDTDLILLKRSSTPVIDGSWVLLRPNFPSYWRAERRHNCSGSCDLEGALAKDQPCICATFIEDECGRSGGGSECQCSVVGADRWDRSSNTF